MQALMRAIPPNGWHYPQAVPWKKEPRVIEESGFDELIDEVTKFRINNRIPLGDPKKDIQEYVVKNFPSFAGAVSSEVPERDFDAEAKNLRERWTNRASNWYALRAGGNTELLEGEIVQERASICEACPFNVQVPQDCQSCIQATQRTLLLVTQNQAKNSHLGVCKILGHDNNSATIMPDVMLKYAQKFQEKLPTFCWLKNTTTSSTPTDAMSDKKI